MASLLINAATRNLAYSSYIETILIRAKLISQNFAQDYTTSKKKEPRFEPQPEGAKPSSSPNSDSRCRSPRVLRRREPCKRSGRPRSPSLESRRAGVAGFKLRPAPKRAWELGVLPGAAHDDRLRTPGRASAAPGQASSPCRHPLPASASPPPCVRRGRHPGSAPRCFLFPAGTAADTSHPGARRRRLRWGPGAWRELLRGKGPGRRGGGLGCGYGG